MCRSERPSSVSILAGAAEVASKHVSAEAGKAATEERHTNEVQRKSQVNRRSRYRVASLKRVLRAEAKQPF